MAVLCIDWTLNYLHNSGTLSTIQFEFHPNPESLFLPNFLLEEISVEIYMPLCERHSEGTKIIRESLKALINRILSTEIKTVY